MPILFYIHSKCVNDVSQQHLLWIIFTASKQHAHVSSWDKNSYVEAVRESLTIELAFEFEFQLDFELDFEL